MMTEKNTVGIKNLRNNSGHKEWLIKINESRSFSPSDFSASKISWPTKKSTYSTHQPLNVHIQDSCKKWPLIGQQL